jgi:hypothetical protein
LQKDEATEDGRAPTEELLIRIDVDEIRRKLAMIEALSSKVLLSERARPRSPRFPVVLFASGSFSLSVEIERAFSYRHDKLKHIGHFEAD